MRCGGRRWADAGISQIVIDCVKQHPWISNDNDLEKLETLTSVVQCCILATCHSTMVWEARANVVIMLYMYIHIYVIIYINSYNKNYTIYTSEIFFLECKNASL